MWSSVSANRCAAGAIFGLPMRWKVPKRIVCPRYYADSWRGTRRASTRKKAPPMRRTVSLLIALCALTGSFVFGMGAAHANRFGPPFQGRVVADNAFVYSQADLNSAIIGPLGHGAIVVVIGEQTDEASHEWTRTTLGFVPSEAVVEYTDAWVADVIAPSTPVFAKPNAKDTVRLEVKQGDLMRVTGVSPGMNGDSQLWWSTTEGYVALSDLAPSENPWSKLWTVPDGLLALNGWWGATTTDANVRVGPSTDAPTIGHLPAGLKVKVSVDGPGQDILGSSTWYEIDGGRYAGGWVHSSLVKKTAQPQANTTAPPMGSVSGRWIVVDRRLHSLTL